jgi:hypothetical protein
MVGLASPISKLILTYLFFPFLCTSMNDTTLRDKKKIFNLKEHPCLLLTRILTTHYICAQIDILKSQTSIIKKYNSPVETI